MSRWEVVTGDARQIIACGIADESIDAVVCDPPYALVSIVKRFGGPNAAPARGNEAYMRASAGFMGKTWDTGETAFDPLFWADVLRVLKPGGHVVAASGTRTYHRLACAVEDAGFEIRDMVSWLYGQGFPKSHDVSKGIDKAAGVERERVAPRSVIAHQRNIGNRRPYMDDPNHTTVSDTPATPEAEQWQGWGTALKPACEPWVLARKPLVGTVASNVLAHGTGAINIDGCRIGINETEREIIDNRSGQDLGKGVSHIAFAQRAENERYKSHAQGRWPANVIHDGSDEVLAGFPQSKDGVAVKRNLDGHTYETNSGPSLKARKSSDIGYGGEGSAARFFYCAKASKSDRSDGNGHPTVKPTDLMRYLCRLITPPGGLILDPFTGSGSTGKAAMLEGFRFIGCEMDPEYAEIARRRIGAACS